MSKEWDPETVFDIMGNEEVRHILAVANIEPVSAQELAEGLDVSEATVYRRVDACQEYDLLTETARIDEEGNHYKVYETNLERVCFEVEGGGYDVNIELRRDLSTSSTTSGTDSEAGRETMVRTELTAYLLSNALVLVLGMLLVGRGIL